MSIRGDMYDIFISYSRNDFDTYSVDKLLESLENRGFKVWLDQEEVDPGAEFMARIFNAIESSTVLVFLSSEQSNQSPYVQLEILYAQAKGKAILPIVLDDSDFNSSLLGFLNSKNFSKWDGRNWTRCVNDIASVLLKNLDADVLYNKAVALRDNNLDQYLDYLEKAARKGHVRSQIELGWHYAGSNQYDAERWLRAAAESEDLQGKLELGRYYLETGNPEGKEKAFSLFKEAANAGSDEAYIELGDYYYREGCFSEEDFSKANKMYNSVHKRDERIYAKSIAHIAILSLIYYYHEKKFSDVLSPAECVEMILKSAELGDADALFMLGQFYEYGWYFAEKYWGEQHFSLYIYPTYGWTLLALEKEPDKLPHLTKTFTIKKVVHEFDAQDIGVPIGGWVAYIDLDKKKACEFYVKSAKKGGILAMTRLVEDYYLFSSFNNSALGELGCLYDESNGLSETNAVWCVKAAARKGIRYAIPLMDKSPDVVDQVLDFWERPNRIPFLCEALYKNFHSRILWLKGCQGSIKPKMEQQLMAQYELAFQMDDEDHRLRILREAAEWGLGPAQLKIVVSTSNPEESFSWLLHYTMTHPVIGAKYCYLLSKYYQFGIGTAVDIQRCLFWLEKSSQRGYGWAKRELAVRYRGGIGVLQNTVKADEIENLPHPYVDMDQLCRESDYESFLNDPLFGKGSKILYKEGIPIIEDVDSDDSTYYSWLMNVLETWDDTRRNFHFSDQVWRNLRFVRPDNRLEEKLSKFHLDFEFSDGNILFGFIDVIDGIHMENLKKEVVSHLKEGSPISISKSDPDNYG